MSKKKKLSFDRFQQDSMLVVVLLDMKKRCRSIKQESINMRTHFAEISCNNNFDYAALLQKSDNFDNFQLS